MRSLAPDDIGFNDLAVEEEKEEMEFNRDEEDRDASPGMSVGVLGATAHPAPFAFAAPPAFVFPTAALAPIVYNNITSPFDKPWDLSLKANQVRWIAATEVYKDHKRFDVSAATAHAFIELVQDKS